MFDVQINCFIIVVVEEIRSPIPLQTSRIEGIEHALQRGKWDRTSKINRRRAEFANWFEYSFRLGQITRVAPHDRTHFLQVILFRERSHWWHGGKCEPAVNILGSAQDKILPEA